MSFFQNHQLGFIFIQAHPFFFRKDWVEQESSEFANSILHLKNETDEQTDPTIVDQLGIAKGTNHISVDLKIPINDNDAVNIEFRSCLFILKNISSKLQLGSLNKFGQSIYYVGFQEFSFNSLPISCSFRSDFDENSRFIKANITFEILSPFGSTKGAKKKKIKPSVNIFCVGAGCYNLEDEII